MPDSSLPRTSPSAVGVDAEGLLAFIDGIEGAGLELHSLMVLRHGQVVAEGWWHPFSAQRPHRLHSLSKSFTSTALAFAVEEGYVDLDDTVLSHFPEYDAHVTDERSRRIRVRHLAAMASGHEDEAWGTVMDAWPTAATDTPIDQDWPVLAFLQIPPDREPGTVFAYNQSCTYTLAAIIQRHAGEPLTSYLRPRLFDRIGIGPVGWETMIPGRNLGFSGLYATTEDIARLAMLYLREGEWDGETVLSPDWVRSATRAHVANGEDPQSDWAQGYGFQFWVSRHGYRGDGAFSQYCLVLPEQDAVVATTAATDDMQAVLDIAWRTLLPALDAGGSPAADARLAERLTALALPPVDGWPTPPAGSPWATPAAAAAAGTTFRRRPGAKAAQRGLRTARMEPAGDGWDLRLVEDGTEVVVPIGLGEWAVAEQDLADGGRPLATATTGGWRPDGSLRVEVVFLETPHRLLLDLRQPATGSGDGSFKARWNFASLRGGALADFRCPVDEAPPTA